MEGEVKIAGAKNSALPILAACLLSAKPIKIRNVPKLKDVTTMMQLLGRMGVRLGIDEYTNIDINAEQVTDLCAPYELGAHHACIDCRARPFGESFWGGGSFSAGWLRDWESSSGYSHSWFRSHGRKNYFRRRLY